MSNNDIYKAAGVIIVNRKVLAERSVGKDFFIHPAARLKKGKQLSRHCCANSEKNSRLTCPKTM